MRPMHTLRPVRAVAAAALVALGAASSARAQSLLELYEAAYGYDATILAARAQADSAQYRTQQADALNLPRVQAQADGTHTQARVRSALDSAFPVHGTTGEAKLAASYPLFNRSNSLTADQARRNEEAASTDLAAAEQDLIVRVVQAYFDVLASQDTLSTTRAAKAAFAEQLASAKRNFEVGTATITDTREAQSRYDLATAQEIAVQNELTFRRIALDQLVGRQNVVPKPLIVPMPLTGPVPAEADLWVATAEQTHPTIRRARLVLDVATLENDKARAAELPVVNLVGDAGASRGTGELANNRNATISSASIGLQFTMPIYSGGAITARINETVALKERARQDLEAVRRNVTQTTRQAYFNLQSQLAQVKALEAAEASSRLALEATQVGYRVGIRINVDVLNAQTQLYQTQAELSRARYDVIIGHLRLRQASGQLTVADIQAANKLLVP